MTQEWQKWHGNRRRQTQMVVALTQALGHHLCVPNQYMGGGLSVRGFKECGLTVGEMRSILGFLPRLLLGKCFARMTFLPKGVNIDWDHLMHAIGVGVKSPQPLSVWGRQCSERGETKQDILFDNGEWCGKHTLSRSSGQAT